MRKKRNFWKHGSRKTKMEKAKEARARKDAAEIAAAKAALGVNK